MQKPGSQASGRFPSGFLRCVYCLMSQRQQACTAMPDIHWDIHSMACSRRSTVMNRDSPQRYMGNSEQRQQGTLPVPFPFIHESVRNRGGRNDPRAMRVASGFLSLLWFKAGFHSIAHHGLDLEAILLPQTPACLNCSHGLSRGFWCCSVSLGVRPWGSDKGVVARQAPYTAPYPQPRLYSSMWVSAMGQVQLVRALRSPHLGFMHFRGAHLSFSR